MTAIAIGIFIGMENPQHSIPTSGKYVESIDTKQYVKSIDNNQNVISR